MDIEPMDWLIRLALALVLSGLVGIERESHRKAAGLRTTILVGLGAAAFTLVSIDGFPGSDPARVAAQIVTGVGFLGAGAIFRHGAAVTGLTTAASLWAVAGVGLAAGAGELAGASIVAGLALLVLWGLRAIETVVRARAHRTGTRFEVDLEDAAVVGRLLKVVQRLDATATIEQFLTSEDGRARVRIRVRPEAAANVEAMSHSIEGIDAVRRTV